MPHAAFCLQVRETDESADASGPPACLRPTSRWPGPGQVNHSCLINSGRGLIRGLNRGGFSCKQPRWLPLIVTRFIALIGCKSMYFGLVDDAPWQSIVNSEVLDWYAFENNLWHEWSKKQVLAPPINCCLHRTTWTCIMHCVDARDTLISTLHNA